MTTNARILVVDDEEDLCEILKFNLEIEGFEVDTANSAEEALKKDLSIYQLLMLDVMMGEISGFKLKLKFPLFFLQQKILKMTVLPVLIWVRTIISPSLFQLGK